MESHAELINNRLVITDSATVEHYRATNNIKRALEDHIRLHDGNCEVFSESVSLYCNELSEDKGNFYLPDVMVVCNKSGIKNDGVHVAPKFVAEITSKSTRKNDYGIKVSVYGNIGVQEYWVVDIQREVIVRYIAENDFVPEMYSYPQSSEVPLHTYPDLKINLSDVFG